MRYIGYCSNPKDRLVKHLSPSKLKTPNHKNNWIKKILKEGSKPNLLILEESPSLEEARESEIFYIDYFKSLGCNLTNTALGGLGGFTGYPSKETLAKLKESGSKPKSQEHKAKISQSHIGLKLTQQTKDKISFSKIGEKNTLAKLNNEKVKEIKNLLQKGILQIKQIAKMFNVSRRTISDIKQGKRWSHVV